MEETSLLEEETGRAECGKEGEGGATGLTTAPARMLRETSLSCFCASWMDFSNLSASWALVIRFFVSRKRSAACKEEEEEIDVEPIGSRHRHHALLLFILLLAVLT